MLRIENLSVAVEGVQVLHDVDLEIPDGELHVLFGPNGSGKSSLLATIMGLEPFTTLRGSISLDGDPLTGVPVDERARRGIGLAFQHPPVLEGVRVTDFARALGAEDRLEDAARALDLSAFSERDVAAGFSGGELKRWEVLKMVLQAPRVLLFDESESGVDLEHVCVIGQAIDALAHEPMASGAAHSGLIITHSGLLLEHVSADVGHLMVGGRIIFSGSPRELFRHIQTHGYTRPQEASC